MWNHWLQIDTQNLSIVISVASALVSLAVFIVGYSQMKIASAKIRLDLYNKRFSIYTAALEYYQSVWWGTLDDVNEKAHLFTKAYRESLFLFSSNDGVYEILGRIQQNGGAILGYLQHEQEKNLGTSDADTTAVLHRHSVEGRAEFEKNLNLLERKLRNTSDSKQFPAGVSFDMIL